MHLNNKREPTNVTSSDTIVVSMSKLKRKYYNPKTETMDLARVRSDIEKIKLDMEAISSGGLYTYDKKNEKYIKIFDDLREDYLRILRVKKIGLENFLKIVTYDHINIPDSFKKKMKELHDTEES